MSHIPRNEPNPIAGIAALILVAVAPCAWGQLIYGNPICGWAQCRIEIPAEE